MEIKTIANQKVFIRRRSIIDRDVIKYTLYKQHHLPLNPLRGEAIIVDLGTNIGLTVKHFRFLYPDSSIYGFEMDKSNFEIALLNNPASSGTHIYQLAIWIQRGEVTYSKNKNEDAYRVINVQQENNQVVKVESVTMQDIITTNQLKNIDYLKIDIEGTEKDILLEKDLEWLSIVRELNIELHDKTFIAPAIRILELHGFKCHKDAGHAMQIRAIQACRNQVSQY
jgi:FkbM family methyltransferase